MNLLTGYISDYLMNYKGMTNPLKFTAIGMLVLVVILYPAFKFLDEMVAVMAQKVMTKGHHMFGKVLGTLIMFAILLFILYCIYAKQWYGINVVKVLVARWF
ncbi:MAG TPA: hypothetical protein VHO90_20530 [Bacteroidales bacterium]|nr:hypothetical protein [Bacteroidales bacterium]